MLTDSHEVPQRLRSTAGDWFDGGNSAMYRFSRDQPYDPVRLLRETRAAAAACLIDAERPRLAELEAFAEGEARRFKARRKLEEAVVECFRSGAEAWQIGKAFDETYRRVSAKIEAEARSHADESEGPKFP